MSVIEITDPAAVPAALETIEPGDRLEAESFAALAQSSGELLSLAEALAQRGAGLVCRAEGVDTDGDGGLFLRVCQSLAALDRQNRAQRRREGIERAKEDGRYKGRRPIAVDEKLFDDIAARWEQGEITAREAMKRLALKPNTFYRRIKEREEQKMKDYKQVEKELRQEIRETGRQSRKAMEDLKKQVKTEARELKKAAEAEAKELKKAAEEKLDLHDVEKELRRDRRQAEAEYKDELRQIKKDVESETAELKKLLSSEE